MATAPLDVTERIRKYPGPNIPRGDALAILGKHPARGAVERMSCAGNHQVGYCAGVVVSKADVLAAIEEQHR